MNTIMNREIDIKAILSHIIRGDGLNKCRICMGDTKEGQVHLEDTVMMDGEKAVTLSEILEIITGIEVLLEEDLPAVLCSTCAMCALNAATFRLLCHQAADQWKLSIKLLNNLPSKNKSSLFAILENNQITMINNECNSKLNLTHSRQTNSNKIKSPPSIYRCIDCSKEFQYPIQLFYHLKQSKYNQACCICGKVMPREDLISHMADFHNRQVYDCRKCPTLLFSEKQFIAHNTNAHSNNSTMCVDCGPGFQSDHSLNAHGTVHQQKMCPNCNKLFRNQPCYLHHVKYCCILDKSRLNAQCSNNKMKIVKNMKINEKIKSTNGNTDKRFICHYCNKTFAAKKFVAAHIQIVHLKNTHRPCLYCGKRLAAAYMSDHVKRHLSTYTYTCEKCGINLKTKLGYTQHQRLHTGEKPYSCKYCGETFSASSRRSEHIRKTHNTKEVILKHVCDLCHARFRLPYRLQRHMRTVHKNSGILKQFQCDLCLQKFDTHRGLLHHNRIKHQVTGIGYNIDTKT